MTSKPTPTSDLDLVRQCLDESRPEAFDELLERHGERIFRVIVRLVGDHDRARDLTQDSFLKAWKGLESFSGQSTFYTWVYRIARNVVSSDFRRQRARPRVVASLVSSGGAAEEQGLEVADERAEPAETVMSDERKELIVDAILELVPDFREIIVLRDVERMSYEEIAAMLQIPVGTVRSRLHRARMELKVKLGDGLGLA